MNINIKEKLAGKGAYIALALLLAAILVFTVIAIVATVNKRNDDVPGIDELPGEDQNQNENNGGDENQEPADGDNDQSNDGDQSTGGDVTDPGDNNQPEVPVYVVPCEGYVNKDYSEDTLVFSQTMNDHRIHLGIDISGKVGDKVMAFSKKGKRRRYLGEALSQVNRCHIPSRGPCLCRLNHQPQNRIWIKNMTRPSNRLAE